MSKLKRKVLLRVPRVPRAREIPAVLFCSEVVSSHRKERLTVQREEIAMHAENGTCSERAAICHQESILIELPGMATFAVDGGNLVEPRRQRLMEGRIHICDPIACDRNCRRCDDLFFRNKLQSDFTTGCEGEFLLARSPKMHSNYGGLTGTTRREKRLDGKFGSPLARVLGSLSDKRDTIRALPVTGLGIEVERHNAAAQHPVIRSAARVVCDNHGSRD